MDIHEYESQFQDILDGKISNAPYDQAAYQNYVKLNQRRIKRWNKMGKLSDELVKTLGHIHEPQQWVLITEPWCGDAANSHAFIRKMAESNPLITLQLQNRDAEGSEIDSYLTNGGKSIPKLIVRDKAGKDLFLWGPRPAEAQAMVMRQKSEDTLRLEERMIEIQNWYNKDKGVSIQAEILALLQSVVPQGSSS